MCVLEGDTIRVSDLYAVSEVLCIDLSYVLPTTTDSPVPRSEPKISLLYFRDDIISVHYERKGRPNDSRIFAISTRRDLPEGNRVLKVLQLESSYKLFARHSAEYLYYGTYTAVGDHGHHEWEIRGTTFDNNKQFPQYPLQLQNFFGNDIGSTIAFEIHDKHFYAVSNQTSFEVEEIDWTSSYRCIRFPLDEPCREAMEINNRVYRRQHIEGPIHDSWTDLTIQFDGLTGKPLIVESRREWQKNSSRQLRTFYMTNFVAETESVAKSADGSPQPQASGALLLPENDSNTALIEPSDMPNYAPAQRQRNWKIHPEFAPDCGSNRSFILAKTKFRAYNYASDAFLDLVEDDRCCNDSSVPPCLRIRVGARRVAPLDWSPNGQTFASGSKACSKAPSKPTEDDDYGYRNCPIKMWPPSGSNCACSKRLHRILNPPLPSDPANTKSITGVLDGRCLIYMVRPKSYGPIDTPGVIVMISFSRSPMPPQRNSRSPVTPCSIDELNPSQWHWQPGVCKLGTCR